MQLRKQHTSSGSSGLSLNSLGLHPSDATELATLLSDHGLAISKQVRSGRVGAAQPSTAPILACLHARGARASMRMPPPARPGSPAHPLTHPRATRPHPQPQAGSVADSPFARHRGGSRSGTPRRSCRGPTADRLRAALPLGGWLRDSVGAGAGASAGSGALGGEWQAGGARVTHGVRCHYSLPIGRPVTLHCLLPCPAPLRPQAWATPWTGPRCAAWLAWRS